MIRAPLRIVYLVGKPQLCCCVMCDSALTEIGFSSWLLLDPHPPSCSCSPGQIYIQSLSVLYWQPMTQGCSYRAVNQKIGRAGPNIEFLGLFELCCKACRLAPEISALCDPDCETLIHSGKVPHFTCHLLQSLKAGFQISHGLALPLSWPLLDYKMV